MQIKDKTEMSLFQKILGVIAIIMLSPLMLIVAGPLLMVYLLKHLWLMCLVKIRWLPMGKSVLFVYSNSPHWKEYIEQNILPKIAAKAVVLNWSEKNTWDWRSLEVKIFKHWSQAQLYKLKGKLKWSGEDYNPMAIVFSKKGSKVIRFWKAFKDYKHGKEKLLRDMEAELFSSVSVQK